MRLKEGVTTFGMRAELLFALIIADRIYNDFGYNMTVTCVTDGRHSANSLHYAGAAADIRTLDITEQYSPHEIAARIKESLGSNPDYDIVVEKTHIHIEFQPKFRSR